MSDYPKITYKKHTFLSALALGLSALAITFIVCCTVIVIYGMHFAGDRAEKLFVLMGDAVEHLPKLQQALPPALSDVLDDHRQPDYANQLLISASTAPSQDEQGRFRTDVKVVNNGTDVVSLLSLRIVVLGAQGEVVCESNEWAATPFAADNEWRGPLLPGSQRYFTCSRRGSSSLSTSDLKTEVEVTDIRLWKGRKETPLVGTEVSLETEISEPLPAEPGEN
ncbi:MAG: hypothetical protein ABIF19_13100 [Planctomycetota bacterium]